MDTRPMAEIIFDRLLEAIELGNISFVKELTKELLHEYGFTSRMLY